MIVALVNNGKVVNVISVDSLENAPQGYQHIIDITNTEVGIGWDYNGQSFTDNRIIESLEEL